MKSIANCISISRIVFAFILYWVKPLSILFFTIYILSGISDVIDGYIARKTNSVSKLGDNIDSIADFVIIVVLIIKLYPIINPTLEIIIWIVIIAIIKIASVILILIKYKTFEMLHTYANKITGFILFIFPILLAFFKLDVLIYITCIIAGISAIEELLINVFSKELRIDKKSLLLK
ncbi:CDP-diacylglycerol--glycerol-3-phosphate 3-phosphatidyltransferase [Clostridium cavendishii DSM 21758]|uniref:CDP-diacylglycerol--glycerol-3-phosphate 3-phosphatidyltransferase n=1 Tax=Clostridium cavendishii DSM 21758 TaxID=1121302 RepID=A0A1M6J491_9CLOT|nr:CDP-alcohol phosphatidyltransferase family protein [Clostridium cavendishii]SHJ41503.1 CDP-diacylglycerol--glycerol-3-phosphate 3-phosphatidyltransferase [Clostridium cavendishii DSM 21758]